MPRICSVLALCVAAAGAVRDTLPVADLLGRVAGQGTSAIFDLKLDRSMEQVPPQKKPIPHPKARPRAALFCRRIARLFYGPGCIDRPSFCELGLGDVQVVTFGSSNCCAGVQVVDHWVATRRKGLCHGVGTTRARVRRRILYPPHLPPPECRRLAVSISTDLCAELFTIDRT